MQDSYVREFGKTTCTDSLARSKLTMVLYHIAAQVANLMYFHIHVSQTRAVVGMFAINWLLVFRDLLSEIYVYIYICIQDLILFAVGPWQLGLNAYVIGLGN